MTVFANSSFLPGLKRIFIYTASFLIFSISANAREVTLQWDPNSEPDLSHYVVYWGLTSGDYSDNSGDIGLVTEHSVEIPDDGQIYYFAVTAVDEAGLESDYSNEVNTGGISTSTPPVSNAGPDQNVNEEQQAALDGSDSFDPDGSIVSWQWTQTDGTPVTLNNSGSMQATFTSPSVDPEGESLTFELTVTDDQGLENTDACNVNIVWVNDPPVADAGSNQDVDEEMQVFLDGSGSADPDGNIVSWQWTQTGGTLVTLSNPSAAQPSFTSPCVDPEGESLTFELTVTDSEGSSNTDTCVINVAWVNDPPAANANTDQIVEEGQQVTLDGSSSIDPDGSIVSWQWTQTGGTPVVLNDSSATQPVFTAPYVNPEGESLTFELTVTDSYGLQSTDFCIINVVWVNDPPVADAGLDQIVNAGESVVLDGSDSFDSDGDIVSYSWFQIDGIQVTLDDSTAIKPVFEAPPVDLQGEILIFKLVVTDNEGLKASSECMIEVNPVVQVLRLKSGWNLISISSGQVNISVKDTFAPVINDVISVWAYDNGAWSVYDPESPELSNLQEVEPGEGLWLNMRNNAELSIPSGISMDTTGLTAGWNLVGFNSQTTQDISDVISPIVENLASIWAYKDGKWKVYDPNHPRFSDLTIMEPGYGYWIKMHNACSWTR